MRSCPKLRPETKVCKTIAMHGREDIAQTRYSVFFHSNAKPSAEDLMVMCPEQTQQISSVLQMLFCGLCISLPYLLLGKCR